MENSKLLELESYLVSKSGLLISTLTRRYFLNETGKLDEIERLWFKGLQDRIADYLEEDDGKQ
ncbi:MAG: hypothetical protein [Bacteriophage sp.]|nr:MAG: hypothetical protein [Bacteriophage sp.]